MHAITHDVRPASARLEGAAVAAATLLIIAALAAFILSRQGNAPSAALLDWQVSAFGTLTGADQAIYNSLYTVRDEIPYLYDDINRVRAPEDPVRWPNLQDLQDSLLPPFYQDHSWEQNGALQWSLHEPLAEGEMQDYTMYLGTDGRLASQGSFLLVIGHVQAGLASNNAVAIWWNSRNHVDMPESGFRDQLILKGWREVVPHSGAAELRRLAGDTDTENAAVEDIIDQALGNQ